MRIKDFTDTIRHLTDPFNIPEARRMIQENPALTQEQFKAGGRAGFKFGGSWADWKANHEDQMSFEEYLKIDIDKPVHPIDKSTGGSVSQLVQPGPGRLGYGLGGHISEQPGGWVVRFGTYGDENYIGQFFSKNKYPDAESVARKFYNKTGKTWETLKLGPQTTPLKDLIVKTYNKIKKGAKTTTDEIFKKIKNSKFVKGKTETGVKGSISKRLTLEKLPFKRGATVHAKRSETYKKRALAAVDADVVQPKVIFSEGKPFDIAFPKEGKDEFIEALKKFYDMPKDDAKISVARKKLINDFFPEGISDDNFNKIIQVLKDKKDIDTNRPLKYGSKTEYWRAQKEARTTAKELYSSVKAEEAVLRAKTGQNLDLAHKLSLGASRRFGLQQTTGTLGLQHPLINQVIAAQYERKLYKLYDLQKKLIKQNPKDLAFQLENINKMITSVVNDSDNVIVGVVLDEKTLKPSLYGNVSGAESALDQGVFKNTLMKDLTEDQIKFINQELVPRSIANEKQIGIDVSRMRNVNAEELLESVAKSAETKPFLEETKRLLKEFPEITATRGVVGTRMDRELYENIAKLGCPGLA